MKKFMIFQCVIVFLSMCSITIFASEEQLIVDVSWLKDHFNESNLVIVDVRPNGDYQKGHISSAVNIPVSSTFNPKIKTDRVANTAHIQMLLGNAGIKQNDSIVLYDAGDHIDAGRVFWVLEVYGHEPVRILNGGFPAWTQSYSDSISTTAPEIKKTVYIPRLEPQRLSTKLSIQLAIENENQIIIDARSDEEYQGKKSIATRFGHIPTAINIPWNENFVTENGISKLKSSSELKELYNQISPDKKVLLYCNKGKQSSLSYLVMRQLGYDAAHYDGSWYEWGNDEILPIEKNFEQE